MKEQPKKTKHKVQASSKASVTAIDGKLFEFVLYNPGKEEAVVYVGEKLYRVPGRKRITVSTDERAP